MLERVRPSLAAAPPLFLTVRACRHARRQWTILTPAGQRCCCFFPRALRVDRQPLVWPFFRLDGSSHVALRSLLVEDASHRQLRARAGLARSCCCGSVQWSKVVLTGCYQGRVVNAEKHRSVRVVAYGLGVWEPFPLPFYSVLSLLGLVRPNKVAC